MTDYMNNYMSDYRNDYVNDFRTSNRLPNNLNWTIGLGGKILFLQIEEIRKWIRCPIFIQIDLNIYIFLCLYTYRHTYFLYTSNGIRK